MILSFGFGKDKFFLKVVFGLVELVNADKTFSGTVQCSSA